MSFKIYIKQFDNSDTLKLTVTAQTTIYDIKRTLRINGYQVQHLMKQGGFAILPDYELLHSLQIFNKSTLMCLLLPSDHYSLIPKEKIFHHNNNTTEGKHECKDGIKCKYYSFCLKYKYNKTKIFQHMTSYQHPNDSICRNGGKCYAFQRCLNDNSYRNDDRCHILAFQHPPKINFKYQLLNKDFNPFIYCNYMMKTRLFDLIIFPNNNEQILAKKIAIKLQRKYGQSYNSEKNIHTNRYKKSDEYFHAKPDYINFLIYEMINNGYQDSLFVPSYDNHNKNESFSIKINETSNKSKESDDDSEDEKESKSNVNLKLEYPSIMKIVEEKMNHEQHKLYGKPLNYGEMLALILYTDYDCKYDMIQCLLYNKNVNKWRWFIYCLDSGIEKLSKYEIGEIDLYSYLSHCNIPKPTKNEPFMYLGTFVDFSWDKTFIQQQSERNNGNGTMIKMICEQKKQNGNDESLVLKMNNNDKSRRIFSGCCDISWIDKFGKERKVVFRPFATFYGYRIVQNDEKQIKIILCHGRMIHMGDEW